MEKKYYYIIFGIIIIVIIIVIIIANKTVYRCIIFIIRCCPNNKEDKSTKQLLDDQQKQISNGPTSDRQDVEISSYVTSNITDRQFSNCNQTFNENQSRGQQVSLEIDKEQSQNIPDQSTIQPSKDLSPNSINQKNNSSQITTQDSQINLPKSQLNSILISKTTQFTQQQSEECRDYRAQLNELLKKNSNLQKCEIDPYCEYIWMGKEGQIMNYCPLCDEWEEISLVQTRQCLYCGLQAVSFYLTPCGHAFHDECVYQFVKGAKKDTEIECYYCTTPIEKALLQRGYLNSN